MRILLIAALILAVVAFVVAMTGHLFLDGTSTTWFLASFMTYLLALVVGDSVHINLRGGSGQT